MNAVCQNPGVSKSFGLAGSTYTTSTWGDSIQGARTGKPKNRGWTAEMSGPWPPDQLGRSPTPPRQALKIPQNSSAECSPHLVKSWCFLRQVQSREMQDSKYLWDITAPPGPIHLGQVDQTCRFLRPHRWPSWNHPIVCPSSKQHDMPCLSPRSVDVYPKTIGCLSQEKFIYQSTFCSQLWTLRFTFAGSRWRFSKTVKSCQWHGVHPLGCVAPDSTNWWSLGGSQFWDIPNVEELNNDPRTWMLWAKACTWVSHFYVLRIVSKYRQYLLVANLFQAWSTFWRPWKLSNQLSHEKSSFLAASNAMAIHRQSMWIHSMDSMELL